MYYVLKTGNIYIDGDNVQAGNSRHKAMSYEYMQRLSKIHAAKDVEGKSPRKRYEKDKKVLLGLYGNRIGLLKDLNTS